MTVYCQSGKSALSRTKSLLSLLSSGQYPTLAVALAKLPGLRTPAAARARSCCRGSEGGAGEGEGARASTPVTYWGRQGLVTVSDSGARHTGCTRRAWMEGRPAGSRTRQDLIRETSTCSYVYWTYKLQVYSRCTDVL